ncbi:MAG TPA: pseudouridine synthase, partial [Candidatus Saccharimonadales bacterium]|nr:pseudouridine synthase [Candidatus Saccharimonadales bacterium]
MTTEPDKAIRLNKHLALQLGISRREADEYIERGYVKVNGIVVNLGARIAKTDTIVVNGKPVATNTSFKYLAFHKPTGYVCSRRSQGDLPTIYELLPSEYHELKTVGRLDFNSSGIILLTNDGDFTYRMTHPKFAKTKIYKVRLDHDLEPLHQQMISDYGVELEDGASKMMLERLSDTDRTDWQVTMSEGRNRQIRRTFASLGYEVKK